MLKGTTHASNIKILQFLFKLDIMFVCSVYFLVWVIMEHYDKVMFHMMTNVCIATDYGTITHFDARFNPKSIFVGMP